jgi:RNA polymerase sigma-70 factor (ECF subfamily)
MVEQRAGEEPSGDRPFEVVAEALRRDDSVAWGALVDRFSQRLIALARSRLFDGRLRQKLDPEDVVQSIYRTFLRRHRRGEFDRTLLSWDSLWGLLMFMTVRRCHKWVQHYSAQKRDPKREADLPKGGGQGGDRVGDAREPADRQPTPEETAMLLEQLRETLHDLSDSERRIVELGLLGCADEEISAEVGRTEHRVLTVREGYARRLQALLDQEASEGDEG